MKITPRLTIRCVYNENFSKVILHLQVEDDLQISSEALSERDFERFSNVLIMINLLMFLIFSM